MTAESETDGDWQRTWHDLWEILGCKWTFHILRILTTNDTGMGFNDIRREIGDITPTMLARRLTQLEEQDILTKSVEASSPPTSSYELTETGEDLADILLEIEQLNPNRESRSQ